MQRRVVLAFEMEWCDDSNPTPMHLDSVGSSAAAEPPLGLLDLHRQRREAFHGVRGPASAPTAEDVSAKTYS